jgi:hypothetical protein
MGDMSEEKHCRIDIKSHPVDGIRFEVEGDKAACDAKRDEILKDAGPYMKKLVIRRWKYENLEATPSLEDKKRRL